jgi:membrane dipeptidase
MILVDGHLDIAFNHACWKRDPRRSGLDVRRDEGTDAERAMRGRCMVGLPELRRGRVGVIFGTIFLPRRKDWEAIGGDLSLAYETAEQAHALGWSQLGLYRRLHDERRGFRLIRASADLDEVVASWDGGAVGDVGIVVLMEGADPIREPDEAADWFDRGVRLGGLSWKGTRYAGGTGEPGPLTPAGRTLVPRLAETGLVLDLSHAAEESFFEALDLSDGSVVASHSNPRAICEGDRQLSDEMIRRIAARDGVIGIVPFNMMLQAGWRDAGRPEIPLARVAEAIEHVVQVAGDPKHVAIGSDLDGGFGAEAAPRGLDTIADLPRIADALADRAFDDATVEAVLGGNWLRLLRRTLPETVPAERG